MELLPSVSSNITSMVTITKTNSVGSLNSLTGSLGECVLNISTSNLGDGVAVLNLNGNNLNLGVINTVSGGDLTASVLHGGDSGVSNSGSNRQVDSGGSMSNSNRSSMSDSKRGSSMVSITITKSSIMSISISFSISLSLVKTMMVSSITQSINNILANLLVFNLLGLNNLGGAHVLGMRSTGLCDKDLLVDNAVRGSGVVSDRGNGSGVSNSYGSSAQVASITQELGVSLSLGGRGCSGSDGKEDNGDELN